MPSLDSSADSRPETSVASDAKVEPNVRLAPEARRALEHAVAFQSFTKQGRLHMEHLLVGLFDAEGTEAGRALRDAGLDRERLRKSLESTERVRAPRAEPFRPLPFSALPTLSKHVAEAVARALELAGAGEISSVHLLRGFLSVGDCSVVKALPSEVLLELRRRFGEIPPPGTAEVASEDAAPDDGSEEGPGARFDPSEFPRLESHVVASLQLAARLAGDRHIDAATALRAVATVSGTRSEAFTHFAEKLVPSLSKVREDALSDDDSGPKTFRLSPALLESLELARKHLPTEGSGFWGRDWIAAVLLAMGDRSLTDLARDAGTSVADLQDRWYSFGAAGESSYEPREWWTDWWKDAGVPLPTERSVRSGYRPESLIPEDKLGIESEVKAFARLIADSTSTLPPLSIGLLGDWGSGKSFFMELLYKEVAKLAVLDSPALCHDVVQIRFNAWHYSDSNLWASLVGHIFDEIWKQIVPQETPADVRRGVEEQLAEARGALYEADAEVEDARSMLKAAEDHRTRLLDQLALKRLFSEKVKSGLGTAVSRLEKAARAIGWTQPLDAIVQIEDALDDLEDSRKRLRLTFETAVRQFPVARTLLWIAVCVAAVPAALWLLDSSWLDLPAVAKQAGQRVATVGAVVGSILSAIAVPLGRARKLVQRFADRAEAAAQQYQKALDEGKKSLRGQKMADEVAKAREDLERAEDRVVAARGRIAELESLRTSLDPGRRLAAFLESRVHGDDYRSRQGILSLVRRDFDKLAELVDDWRADADSRPAEVEPLDRIVLYVDDLDRCNPSIVVQTLEAIHLLLALKLFVVVVAVDSRWLLRSLEVHYRELLIDEAGNGKGASAARADKAYRASTPQNYLEKIFQITFALAPMTPDGFSRYVDYLAEPVTEPPPAEPASEATSSEGKTGAAPEPKGEETHETQPESSNGQERPHGGSSEAQDASSSDTSAGDHAESSSPSPIDMTRPLTICEAERDFLKQLHPLVSTPRLTKRLVNVFRLLKGRVPAAELEAFEERGHGRHRVILLLLAILYGRQDVALALFRWLCNDPEKGILKQPLHKVLRGLDPTEKGPEEELAGSWEELASLVQEVAEDLKVDDCRAEARRIARYSLVTGPHWHTWRQSEQPAAANPDGKKKRPGGVGDGEAVQAAYAQGAEGSKRR